MLRMPGQSYRGPLLPLTENEKTLRDALRRDVERLAGQIGERNVWQYPKLVAAANFLKESLSAAGHQVYQQEYTVEGQLCHNLEVEIRGAKRTNEIVVVGSHYDSVFQCPGANDNATGVAAVLALARELSGKRTARTLRLIEFVNEEPPFFQTAQMGSAVYAKRCRERNENVVAMLSLETMGYYSDEKGSQNYPFPLSLFYPSTGNFIRFVGNASSRELVRNVVAAFRNHAKFPSEGAVAPSMMAGVGWSDHWAFWQEGYTALMVTDTAPFRYRYYHTPEDTPDKVDYDRLARVVAGLEKVVSDLAGLIAGNASQ